MRLLDTTTLECKEFWGRQIPSYAILSHTWSRNSTNEVSLQDLRTGHAKRKKVGFAKLRSFCELAKSHRLSYAWMDTCCIDKTSSAEESEAINSMYRLYEGSTICYAYLEDIQDGGDPIEDNPKFKQSRWFTRGWTLQELIAPSQIYFYSVNWKVLGCKLRQDRAGGEVSFYRTQFPFPVAPDLSTALSKITGINIGVLRKQVIPQDCSAAMRMSWAAFRQTTRPEDIAYCLMGIFDVNMSALYGEGEKNAFRRLQEEFLRTTQDDTLLMHMCSSSNCHHAYHPPLASSPEGFRGLGDIMKGDNEAVFRGRNIPSQMTPSGLKIQLPICPCEFESNEPQRHERAYIAILDCIIPGSYLDRGVIVLHHLPTGAFARYANSLLSRLDFEKQEVVMKTKDLLTTNKVTSINIDKIRLTTIHISDYTTNDIFKSFFVSQHMELTFQGIEQTPGCDIVLHQDSGTSRIGRRFLSKHTRLCCLVDKTNRDAFIIVLGAHKISCGHGGDQSVPYCKIFPKDPHLKLQDIMEQERNEDMYPDVDWDSIQEQDTLLQSALNQPPIPQYAKLNLAGSKTAELTVCSKRFLNREEHCFKVTIKETI